MSGADHKQNKIAAMRADARKELQFDSERASNASRRMALAVVGVTWGLLVLGKGAALIESEWQYYFSIVAMTVAVLSLSADWLQMVFGYKSSERDFERVDSDDFDPDVEGRFEYSSFYQSTVWMFWGKQALAVASVLLFLIAVAPSLIGDSPFQQDASTKRAGEGLTASRSIEP